MWSRSRYRPHWFGLEFPFAAREEDFYDLATLIRTAPRRLSPGHTNHYARILLRWVDTNRRHAPLANLAGHCGKTGRFGGTDGPRRLAGPSLRRGRIWLRALQRCRRTRLLTGRKAVCDQYDHGGFSQSSHCASCSASSKISLVRQASIFHTIIITTLRMIHHTVICHSGNQIRSIESLIDFPFQSSQFCINKNYFSYFSNQRLMIISNLR